ncbi:uncharacterized protein LOC106670315 isoform X1 [Cimex lectularius]|uniref:Uncharacterized protein n=1 Tax=Cimex lectularius TaxID=79782 RepID=A0A8I6S4P9_CIMLE|nr:uncharacterized protein LOC106670315 isoform X1 [Cimex lectularius]
MKSQVAQFSVLIYLIIQLKTYFLLICYLKTLFVIDNKINYAIQDLQIHLVNWCGALKYLLHSSDYLTRCGHGNLRHSPAEWNILRHFTTVNDTPMDPWQQFPTEENIGDPPRRRRFWARQRRENQRGTELTWRISLPQVGPVSARESWQTVRKTISLLGVRTSDAYL